MIKLKKLYKRSTTGKITEWEIVVEKDSYYTISGFTDGQKVTSQKTVCDAKSYCSAEEQALKEATAIHRKKMETGSFEDISQIDNKMFFEPMLAHKYEDYKTKIKFPLASQKKLDGVRCIIRKDGMWSRNGKKIISAPHIFESLKTLFETNPDLILDGELFALKESCDFNKIISCVKKTKPKHEDLIESEKYIQYWIYDCPSNSGIFTERIEFLKTLVLSEYCVLVSTEIVNNENELIELYKEYINDGFEGQMLRVLDSPYQTKRSSYLLKHKSFMDDEYVILDILEGQGKLTGKAGTMVFETKNGDRFNSSINGDHSYLEEIWLNKDKFIGLTATVKYFELTNTENPVPRFPKVTQVAREIWE
jgi:ATP-dependent DNA ligase